MTEEVGIPVIKEMCRACFYAELDKVSGNFFCTNTISAMLNRFVKSNDKCEHYKENTPDFLRKLGVIK